VEAFEEIIRFFYFGNLRCEDTTSVSFLLKLLHLADRLLATQCFTHISDAIKAEVNGVHRPVKRADILKFFEAPSSAKESLNSFFTEALVAELGELETVFHSYPFEDDRKAFFCSLPFSAILCLLSLDALNILCENIALSSAIEWVASAGDKCSELELNQLRTCICMASLDLSVINEVISKVDWLKVSDTDRERLIATAYALKRFPSTFIDFDQDYDCYFESMDNETPNAWFKKRHYLIPHTNEQALAMDDIEIDEAVITRLFKNLSETLTSDPLGTWRGFSFQLAIVINDSGMLMGSVICTFPTGKREQVIHMRVKIQVTVGTKQLNAFHQMTCQFFKWHDAIVPNGEVSLEQFKGAFGVENFPVNLSIIIHQVYI